MLRREPFLHLPVPHATAQELPGGYARTPCLAFQRVVVRCRHLHREAVFQLICRSLLGATSLVSSYCFLLMLHTFITVYNTTNSHTYTNLTLEQALELVIYYYRNYENSNDHIAYADFVQALVKAEKSLDEILDSIILAEPNFISNNSYTLSRLTANNSVNNYIIAVGTIKGENSTRFEKVSSNVVKISYSVSATNVTSFGYESRCKPLHYIVSCSSCASAPGRTRRKRPRRWGYARRSRS